MTKHLDGKVALISGGSKGIGRACAIKFAEHGANVAITGRTVTELEATAESAREHGNEALVCESDFLDPEQVAAVPDKVTERFGRIDILINNAAIIHPRINLVDFEPEMWYDVMEVNLNSAAMLTKYALPAMVEHGDGGHIINISSIGGRKGAAGRTAYRVTKAALISLTESLVGEVHEHGINVNTICPGGTDTEGYREAFGSAGRSENPRLLWPEEIANLALYLTTDQASAVTGAAIDAFGNSNPLL